MRLSVRHRACSRVETGSVVTKLRFQKVIHGGNWFAELVQTLGHMLGNKGPRWNFVHCKNSSISHNEIGATEFGVDVVETTQQFLRFG